MWLTGCPECEMIGIAGMVAGMELWNVRLDEELQCMLEIYSKGNFVV